MLDASVVASWFFPKQATDEAMALLDMRPQPRWRAPHCFAFEVLNMLLRQERRGALPAGATEVLWSELRGKLGVVCVEAPDERTTHRILRLARDHALSLFDASYLLLARTLEAPLATRDRVLAAAARREGCELLEVDAGL